MEEATLRDTSESLNEHGKRFLQQVEVVEAACVGKACPLVKKPITPAPSKIIPTIQVYISTHKQIIMLQMILI